MEWIVGLIGIIVIAAFAIGVLLLFVTETGKAILFCLFFLCVVCFGVCALGHFVLIEIPLFGRWIIENNA